MTRSVAVVAALLALAGCDEYYVQTRDAPKTVEEAEWDRNAFYRPGDDRTVRELPTKPPALEEHRPYRCAKPGVGFFPPSDVAWDDRPAQRPLRAEFQRIGTMSEDLALNGALKPLPEPPLGAGGGPGWTKSPPDGRVPQPAGAWDDRPALRTRGYTTIPADRMGAWRTDELVWCEPASP